MKKLFLTLSAIACAIAVLRAATTNGLLFNSDNVNASVSTVTVGGTGTNLDTVIAPGGVQTGSGTNTAGEYTMFVTNSTTYTLTLQPSASQAASVRLSVGTGAGLWSSTVSGTNETTARISNSAGLASAISDASGSGALIFAGGNLGSATATTQSPGDNSTKVATTAFVTAAVGAGGGGSLTTNNVVYPLSYSYTDTGPTNSTTETTIWTNTIPANAMGTNRLLETVLCLDVFNNSGSSQTTSIIKVYSGSTVIYQDTIATIQNLANHIPTMLKLYFGASGSTSSQKLYLEWFGGGNGTSTTGVGEFGNILNPAGGQTVVSATSSVDTSVARGFGVTITLGNANANYAILCRRGQDRIW